MELEIWLLGIILPFFASFAFTVWIFPYVLRMAKEKDIVDVPNYRKLQKVAVPVMGGFAVFFGIIAGAGLTSVFINTYNLFTCIVALTFMMFFGLLDDTIGLSPWLRIIIEVMIIGFIVKMDLVNLNDFHGLFGIHKLPVLVSLPLCAIAGVGIVNAINMIDGVDGLSSSFCILACLEFGIAFCASFDGLMAIMASLASGALIPFFLHNVFGTKTKMYIGDSGSMMIGMLLMIFCMHTMDNTSRVAYNFPNLGIVAFCLAILSVPVFDTIRVMLGRISKGVSPFHPDKSHLHHLFIQFGFSHIGTCLMINALNTLCVLCLMFVYIVLRADATVQFLVVFVIGIFNTYGVHYIVSNMNHERLPYRVLHWLAVKSQCTDSKWFHSISKFVERAHCTH